MFRKEIIYYKPKRKITHIRNNCPSTLILDPQRIEANQSLGFTRFGTSIRNDYRQMFYRLIIRNAVLVLSIKALPVNYLDGKSYSERTYTFINIIYYLTFFVIKSITCCFFSFCL